ncbi:MAG: serine hydroxymethyltransferase [Fibrobacterales bacterium]
MSLLQNQDADLANLITKEEERQEYGIELIASENYASKAVMEALGTCLTNKYSEGYVGKRYYGGNEVIDEVEQMAIDRAKELFGAEHVNVQALSGSPANTAVYFAMIEPGDKVLGLKLDHGGHLSHGHPVNFSGKLYDFVQYEVDQESGRIDMEKVREIALKEKPKMILAGFSAYSRDIDWKKFKEIADEVGAITFADIAHIAGLIAGKAIENPVPFFDVVTTTTHKTLRGPRGAIIMCKEEHAKAIDRAVFPGLQGGPHDNVTAAKAVAFQEALDPSFQVYAKNVITNAQKMAEVIQARGIKIISGGTDNHLMIMDTFASKEIPGKKAEQILDEVGISTSRSTVPFDPRSPFSPSGVRLGTAAVTTRDMGAPEMEVIANAICDALDCGEDEAKLAVIRQTVKDLCIKFPLYK